MGVTLERVQNKFACIIGELCSEPMVLSQFAVWVDLRIAEYKTNGTISLDCSGDSPNPKWMKGVKTQPQRPGSNSRDTGQRSHYRQDSYSSSPISSPSYNDRVQPPESSQQPFSRLSPDIVVVKDEQSFDQQSSCALSRKRHSDGNDWQTDFYSPSKSRRLGNNLSALSSTAQESSSNQSLMSIINTENDSVTLEQVDPSDSDIFKGTMETMQAEFGASQELSSSNTEFSPHLPTTSTTSSPSQSAWPNQFSQSAQGSSSQGELCLHKESSTTSERGPEFSSHEPLSNSEGKPRNTVRKSDAAIRALEYWLWTYRNDDRRIDAIPPEELNVILAEFFSTVSKREGRDYLPNSLAALRSGIEYYLRKKNYPQSIRDSSAFLQTRVAFRERMNKLRSKPRK